MKKETSRCYDLFKRVLSYFLENRWSAEMLKKLSNIYREEIIMNTPSDIRIIDLEDIKITEEIHQETIKDENSVVSWVIAISTFLVGLLAIIVFYFYKRKSDSGDNETNEYQAGSPISSAPTDENMMVMMNSQNRLSAKKSENTENNSEDKNFCLNLKDVTTNLFNKQRFESGRTENSGSSNPSSQTSNFSSVNCLGRQIEVGRNTLKGLRRGTNQAGENATESPADFRRNSRTSNRIIEETKNNNEPYPNESIVLKSGVTENSSLHSPEYDVQRVDNFNKIELL